MKLHFDSNQEYQWDAIKSITDIFEGQPLNTGDFEFSNTETGTLLSENGFGNKLNLTDGQVLNRLNVLPDAETKSSGQELRGSERMKIKCGKNHFREFEEVKFEQVSKLTELNK
ncbi:MAG: hypothetical protein ABI366_08245 [Ginsengibacter sp.]